MTEREQLEQKAKEEASERFKKLTATADKVADELQADVLLFNGDMYQEMAPDEKLIDLCSDRALHTNVLLVLVTNGGDPHVAFRIARYLQQKYTKFTVFIPGWCKSAGTLITIGAHNIVLSDNGQLGPLDVQVSKPDELFESGSGLDLIQALDFLKSRSFAMFEDNFIKMKSKSGNRLSTKTAMEMSTALTVGLFQPIYEQIEPTRLGEISRAMRITQDYGQRLDRKSGNLKDSALLRLVNGYPSHGFVIDREEADTLFKGVREPGEHEKALVNCLEKFLPNITRNPNVHGDSGDAYIQPLMQFLSTTNKWETGKEENDGQSHGGDPEGDPEGEREEAGRASGDTGGELTTSFTSDGREEAK